MAKQAATTHIHNGGFVTWPKLSVILVVVTLAILGGCAWMVGQHAGIMVHPGAMPEGQISSEIKRIDQRLQRMEVDLREIKREVQSK